MKLFLKFITDFSIFFLINVILRAALGLQPRVESSFHIYSLSPPSPQHTAFPTINILNQSVEFLSVVELTLTNHYHSNFIVDIKVHA